MNKAAPLNKRVPPGEHLKRWLILPDVHAPYHDARAWALVMRVIEHFQFHGVLILGDFFDCYAVSDHRKDPTRERQVKRELREARKLIEQLDAYGFAEKIFIYGNHCWRFERYLQDKAPELYEMWETGEVFGLDKSWTIVPYMEDVALGKAHATHDLGKAGETALRAAMIDYMDNIYIGHTHLFEYRVKGNAKGVPHFGASFGWLGDVKRIDYKHQVKARKDYVLGFGVARLRSNGVIYTEPVPIVNYTAVVEGKLFWLSEAKAC